MFSNIKKVVAGLAFAGLCVAPAIAGSFYIDTFGTTSGTAVVPSMGSCGQVCYSSSPYSWSTASGPLGTQTLNGYNGTSGANNEYLVRSGSVAPGSYNCSVYAVSGGYAAVSINW